MSDAPMFPNIESTEELKAAAYAKGWNDCKAAILAHIASNTVPMVEQVPTLKQAGDLLPRYEPAYFSPLWYVWDRMNGISVTMKGYDTPIEAKQACDRLNRKQPPYVQQSGRAQRIVKAERFVPRLHGGLWHAWDADGNMCLAQGHVEKIDCMNHCNRLNRED